MRISDLEVTTCIVRLVGDGACTERSNDSGVSGLMNLTWGRHRQFWHIWLWSLCVLCTEMVCFFFLLFFLAAMDFNHDMLFLLKPLSSCTLAEHLPLYSLSWQLLLALSCFPVWSSFCRFFLLANLFWSFGISLIVSHTCFTHQLFCCYQLFNSSTIQSSGRTGFPHF